MTERFTGLAKVVRTGKGVPNLPTVVMPLNPEFYPEGRLEREVDVMVGQLVELLTGTQPARGA